jgi:hypothetical protein
VPERVMKRSEMIRRLDDAAREVHSRLMNGPLTEQERHDLASTLERLLPIVANSLQDEIAQEAAEKLIRSLPARISQG